MSSRAIIFASPALCIGLLSVITVDSSRRVPPQDAAPYHQQAKTAIEAFPYVIGYWTGAVEPVPDAAVKLLRPNALVSRHTLTRRMSGRPGPTCSLSNVPTLAT